MLRESAVLSVYTLVMVSSQTNGTQGVISRVTTRTEATPLRLRIEDWRKYRKGRFSDTCPKSESHYLWIQSLANRFRTRCPKSRISPLLPGLVEQSGRRHVRNF